MLTATFQLSRFQTISALTTNIFQALFDMHQVFIGFLHFHPGKYHQAYKITHENTHNLYGIVINCESVRPELFEISLG